MNIARKTSLTFEEKIKAAYLHFYIGLDQALVALIFDGINQGRVNECCKTIQRALQEEPDNAVVRFGDRA